MKKLLILTAIVLMGLGVGTAQAFTWNFSVPTGDLGSNTHTYFDIETGTIGITAKGYLTAPVAPTIGTWTLTSLVPIDLFGKVNGFNDTGLGLADDPESEILPQRLIQLSLGNLSGLENLTMTISSIGNNEGFEVFGGNSAAAIGATGTLRNSGVGGLGELPETFSLNNFPNDKYIWITATLIDPNYPANVLLGDGLIATAVPGPTTLLLLGSGLLGIGGFAWRRNRK